MIWPSVSAIGVHWSALPEVITKEVARFYAVTAFIIGLLFIGFYIYLRREIRKDNEIPNRRNRALQWRD